MADIVGNIATENTLNGNLNAVYSKDGLSAYEIALANGFEGTEAEWLDSLHGKDGADGIKGQDGYTPIKGVDYFDGEQGVKGDTGNSGVYVGTGDMPADCNVQIDPNGDAIGVEVIIDEVFAKSQTYIDEQLGVIENGSY